MKKLNDQLKTLNVLRAKIGKKPLSDWKESGSKLQEMIRKTEAIIKANADAQAETADKTPTPKVSNSQKKDLAKLVASKKEGTKAADKAEGNKDRFRGIDPKQARAKLRKAFGSDWKTKTPDEIAAILFPKKS